MIRLPQNCRYSEPSVSPSDWKGTAKNLLKKPWYIKYRFYDDNLKKSKAIMIRANKLGDVEQRQQFIRETLAGIKQALEVNGYNPITKKSITDFTDTSTSDITPGTSFIDALKYTLGTMKKAELTMRDLTIHVANVEAIAAEMGLTHYPISSITRKRWRVILDKCSILKSGLVSEDKFNRHRSSMGIIYTELMEFEAVEANIPYSIKPRKKEAKPPKKLLTLAERRKIAKYLSGRDPRFLIFLEIFFHSGSRIREMLRVTLEDVDLKNQSVRYKVLKGPKYTYRDRPIRDIAVSLWEQAIAGADKKQFIWGPNLLPGDKSYTYNALRLKWERMCEVLDIENGIYILKHLNATETRKVASLREVAIQNAESEEMINKIYDVESQQREHDALKKINIPFS